jgi:hypothetical protein
MEIVIALPFLIIPLFFPVVSGLMARGFGRKFWPWFFMGLFLPLIANIILLCLPDRSKPKQLLVGGPVENEQLFDHLFAEAQDKQIA